MATVSPPALDFSQLMSLLSLNWRNRDLLPAFGDGNAALLALFKGALETGVMDLKVPVTQAGAGALVAWDLGLEAGVPRDILLLAAARHPPLGPVVGGTPAFIQALAGMVGTGGSKPDAHRIIDWITAASRESIVSLDGPSQAEGQGLLNWLVARKSRLCGNMTSADWRMLAQCLAEKGIDWAHPAIDLPKTIPPPLLESLLQRGLDLESNCAAGTPLWEAMLEWSRPNVTAVLLPYMDKLKGRAKSACQIAAYLGKFGTLASSARTHGRRKAGASDASRQQVLDHLLSRKDWMDVADHHGRSAFFHAAMANPAILRTVMALIQAASTPPETKAQWVAALSHQDRKRRGLWFYLIPCRSHPTLTQKLVDAIGEYVPRFPDWVEKLLEDPQESLAALNLPGQDYPLTALPVAIHRASSWAYRVYGPPVLPVNPGRRRQALAGALRSPSISHDVMDALPRESSLAAACAWCSMCQAGLKDLEKSHTWPQVRAFMAQDKVALDRLVFPVSPEMFAEQRRRLEAKATPTPAVRAALDCLARLAIHDRLEKLPLPAASSTPHRSSRL